MSPRGFRRSLQGMLVMSLLAVVSLVSAAASGAAPLPTLSLVVTKTSITVSGAAQSGGVNVVSTATGLKEANTILFLLKPGATVAEVEAAMKAGAGKDPNRTAKYGSIVFNAEVSGAQKSEVQTNLVPGQYVALGGTGEGPKVKTQFTVKPAPAPVALPAPQATVGEIDFGFTGPSTLHDGELVRFENEGFVVHMDFGFPVRSRADAKKVVRALLSGHEKGAEKLVAGQPVSFAGPLSHEAFVQETITAKPGWYVEVCFMQTQDGRDHARLGMERIIKIVK